MIFVVRRNKRPLAVTPDTAGTGQVMDQATQSMLVFISNLLLTPSEFVRPYLLKSNLSHGIISLAFYIIFFTHFFLQPLVFVYFKLHHWQCVLQALKSCLQ
ncbi:uncharacterized protein LOC123508582 [Portunus trituberculatus]|uniref:uncharacterized protein LOC123508582 n=1 Tax=Portunus trituberculatus TaxID=210409 RepID=UPI001E1D12D2|nr:uncharacterized protein LOC123508582 [Portunus trituberculatus]